MSGIESNLPRSEARYYLFNKNLHLFREAQNVMELPWELISGVIGGLVGAGAAVVFQEIVRWYRQPTLIVECGSSTVGCLVKTRAKFEDDGEISYGNKKFARLCVRNWGLTEAKNVRVIILRILNDSPKKWEFSEEVMNLRWSGSGSIEVNIPSQTHLFIDLCASSMSDRWSSAQLMLDVPNPPSRLADAGPAVGSLRFFGCVVSDNSVTVKFNTSIRWDGSLEGISFESEQEKFRY